MFGRRRIEELEYRLNEANKDLDKAKNEIKALEGKVSSSLSRSKELEGNLEEARARAEELDGKLSEMTSKASDLEERLSAEVSKSEGLDALLTEEKTKNDELSGALSDADRKSSDLEKSLSNANYKIANLEESITLRDARIEELDAALANAGAQIGELESDVTNLKAENADLAQKLADSELEELKEEARATKIEFEGMYDLYARKVREFDETIDEKEQAFAREDAIQRYNLKNEIQENKQQNEEYVAQTVQKFSESYNYYLNQIKLLMDALGDVAVQTGQCLFSGVGTGKDLKGLIGQNMAAKLQSETGSLREDEDGMVLIGNARKAEEESPEEAGAEEALAAEEKAADADEAATEAEAASSIENVAPIEDMED